MTTQDAAPGCDQPVADLTERTAQLIANRACCGTEHDPANGKLHGYCVVCGVPWPCEYAGCRAPQSDSLAVAQALEQAAKGALSDIAQIYGLLQEGEYDKADDYCRCAAERYARPELISTIAAEARRQAEDAKLGKRFRAYVAGSDLSPPTHEEKMSSGFDDWAEKEWTELQDAARGAK